MEKLGRFILTCINWGLNLAIIIGILFVVITLMMGMTFQESFYKTSQWIENSWNHLWGMSSPELTQEVGQEQLNEAHRHLYEQEIVVEDDKITKGVVKQPYLK